MLQYTKQCYLQQYTHAHCTHIFKQTSSQLLYIRRKNTPKKIISKHIYKYIFKIRILKSNTSTQFQHIFIAMQIYCIYNM